MQWKITSMEDWASAADATGERSHLVADWDESRSYWEGRAERFLGRGDELAAVCSYGMPRFYNAYIEGTQRLALARHLRVGPQEQVLDVGCGVGRWSLRMARRGASVTGVDLSDAMLERARRRSLARGLEARTRFVRGDVAELALGERFDRILAVTVLQHVLEERRCREAIARLASHLRPGGRLIALEAAPSRRITRCDTGVFRARSRDDYLTWFRDAGLRCVELTGVDPMPLKTWYLPWHRRLPGALARPALLGVTALSAPIDWALGRRLEAWSWHKVFVLQRDAGEAA